VCGWESVDSRETHGILVGMEQNVAQNGNGRAGGDAKDGGERVKMGTVISNAAHHLRSYRPSPVYILLVFTFVLSAIYAITRQHELTPSCSSCHFVVLPFSCRSR